MHGNVMVAGVTGSGKSAAVREMLKQDSSEVKVVLGKETKALARDMAKWSIENSSRCIYDNLDDQQRVFPLSVLPRNDDRELCIEGTLESLMRRRGSANADQNPLLETVTETWMNLIYDLDIEVSEAMHLFRSGTRVRDVGLSSDFWNDIPGGAARERVLGPTERLTSILRKPCVARRITRDGNKFLEMIDQGYSYNLEGGHQITQAELRFVIGMRLNEIIRYKRTGGQRTITCVIEESEALGLTQQEAVAIQTLRKTGLKWVIVCQEPNWG